LEEGGGVEPCEDVEEERKGMENIREEGSEHFSPQLRSRSLDER
jgi:hypothetical protein